MLSSRLNALVIPTSHTRARRPRPRCRSRTARPRRPHPITIARGAELRDDFRQRPPGVEASSSQSRGEDSAYNRRRSRAPPSWARSHRWATARWGRCRRRGRSRSRRRRTSASTRGWSSVRWWAPRPSRFSETRVQQQHGHEKSDGQSGDRDGRAHRHGCSWIRLAWAQALYLSAPISIRRWPSTPT